MIDVVKYEKGGIHLGRGVRSALNLKKFQNVFLYEDLPNTQIVLTIYQLQISLYHSTIIFEKIENFVEFGEELSTKKINILHSFFYKFGEIYRMSIVFELKEQNNSSDFINELINISKKYNVEIAEIYNHSDEKIEKIKNIFKNLIELSNFKKTTVPKIVNINKNFIIHYNLSKDFKERLAHLENNKLKCVQIADSNTGVLIMTFHYSNIEKVGIQYIHLPGSLARIINIFMALNIEIVASDNQVISFESGKPIEGTFILKYSLGMANKLRIIKDNETVIDTELKDILIETDIMLGKTDSHHKVIVNEHTELLNKLGLKATSFIINIKRFSLSSNKPKKNKGKSKTVNE